MRARAPAFSLASCAVLAAVSGCPSPAKKPIQLIAGPTADDRVEFVPEAAFAEYYELDGLRSELRITLTSYQASCDSFAVPTGKNVSVVVSVVSPPGTAPKPGSYVWAGHEAHGGTPGRPERPFAAPTARIGALGFVLPPGGSVKLESVARELDGRIKGYLAFEFPGDAERSATSLRGSFEAKLCRLSVRE